MFLQPSYQRACHDTSSSAATELSSAPETPAVENGAQIAARLSRSNQFVMRAEMWWTFAIWLLCTTSAIAGCDLRFMEPKPVVVKRFGSKTAVVKRTLSQLKLSLNETIIMHCPTGIVINRNSGQTVQINEATAELHCTQEGIYFNDRQVIQHYHMVDVSCNTGFSQTLYESNRSLSGCLGDAMTLLVGYKLQGLPDVKQLGICYDLSATRLLFVSYAAYASRNVLFGGQVDSPHELKDLKLDTNIGSLSKYFRYRTESEFEQLLSVQKRFGELFDPMKFEYKSLMQDTQLANDLTNYNDILSIVWLRALRSGNWRHWLSALRAAAASSPNDAIHGSERFEVRLGVSGVATLPMDYGRNGSVPLLLTDSSGDNLAIPKNIWAHVRELQPTGTVADEFVIVGHNSPYSDIMELSAFCTDICAEIPWLSNTRFGQMHLVPNYGVVQCCRMNQLQKLIDFPLTPSPAEPLNATHVVADRFKRT